MGTQVNKIRIRGDKIIWIMVFIFAMISIVILYSSTSALASRTNSTPFEIAMKQMFSFILGFGGMIICYLIPLRWWRRLVFYMLGLSGILLLFTQFIGDHRHLEIFKLSVQPSELAKISVVLYLGRILEISKMENFKEYGFKILLPLGAICALTFRGSVSATLIILTVSVAIIICSEIKRRYIIYTMLILLAAGGIAVGSYVLTKGRIELSPRIGTVMNRFERHFADEESQAQMTEEEKQDYDAKMEQSRHSREAIQLGGITGRGPGNGHKKYVLPNAYDDYVFSCIVEEYGLLGAVTIMLLYIVFYYRCIIIAQACRKTFSVIVTLGLGLLIVLQAFLHIFVNTGIIPPTGQTLPLVSNGGTSVVILSCAVGVILSINRTIELTVEKEKITALEIEEQRRREEKRIREEIKTLN